jgi:hypothetical protein
MMGWKNKLGAALLCLGCLPAWATTLSVTATPDATTPGSKLSVAVKVSEVSKLAAYNFALSYDASILKLTDYTVGNFLGSGGAETDQGYFGADPGFIGYVYGTIVSDFSGVDGSGALAYFTFETLAAGVSALTLSDTLLVSNAGDEIAAIVQNGSVAVATPGTDVPEPASWMLVGVGLAGAGALRRRRVRAVTALA